MKKYLILICAIFITGCSAEYNLIIKDNSYKDSLLLYGNQNLLKEQLEEEDNNIDIMIATIRQEKPNYKEKIIEKHKGEIIVNSEVGKGSEFIITIHCE